MCKNKNNKSNYVQHKTVQALQFNLNKTNSKNHTKCKGRIENKTGILSYVSNGEMRSGNKVCKNRATTVLGRARNVDRIPMCSFTATIHTTSILIPSIDKFVETTNYSTSVRHSDSRALSFPETNATHFATLSCLWMSITDS